MASLDLGLGPDRRLKNEGFGTRSGGVTGIFLYFSQMVFEK